MRTKTKTSLVWLCFVSIAQLIAASTPNSPMSLTIDGPAKSASLSPSQPEAWFALSGDLHETSHLILQTGGNADPEMAIYLNVQDALADEPIEEDRDSGSSANARIERFAGFPLPWLIRIRLETSTDVGTVSVSATSALNPPETCSGAGPCPFSVASRGRLGGADLLATMRGVRNFLLKQTPAGSDLVDLYYALSKDLLPEVVLDSELRDELYRLGSQVAPEIREALKTGLGDTSSYVISVEATAVARELTNLVAPHVAAELAARLESWTSRLEEQAGAPIAEAIDALGLTAGGPPTHTLPEDTVFPVRRGKLVVKFARTPANTRAFGDRLETGLLAADRILSQYEVRKSQPLFASPRSIGSAGLERVLVLEVSPERATALVKALSTSPDVEYARNVPVSYLESDDVYFVYQYGPEAIQAPILWGAPPAAHPLTAVIDTGIDPRQADLAGRVRLDLGWNYVDGNADTMDDHGHGTHVSGTMVAAVDNVYSVAGIAPDARVIPFKVCNADGSCSYDWIAQAIVAAADAGARVVNMSLGGPEEPFVDDALEYAYNAGVTLIAAAGNDGADGSSFPGSSSFTLSVGASDENNQLASFSNYGDIDLVAPGVDIVNLGLEGVSCYSSGTSMASPHVAGAAAQVLSALPALSRQQVTDRLLLGAVDLGAPGSDPEFGHGLINIVNAMFANCSTTAVLELSNTTVSAEQHFEACARIITGPNFRITPTGRATLESGIEVALGNGFTVDSGGELAIVINPSLATPQ